MTRAIVAGAGLGGLTASLALRAVGCEVTVLERASAAELRLDAQRSGAGLTLWPNGVAILEQLGVLERLPPVNVPAGTFTFRTSRGNPIHEDDYSLIPDRYGKPVMPLHRADVFRALLETNGADHVEFEWTVVGYRDDGRQVTVSAADGREVRVMSSSEPTAFPRPCAARSWATGLRSTRVYRPGER